MIKKIRAIRKNRKILLAFIAVLLITYFNINLKLSYEIKRELDYAKKDGQITELCQLERTSEKNDNRAKLYLAAAEMVDFGDFQWEESIKDTYEKHKEVIREKINKNTETLELMERAMKMEKCNFNYQFEKGFDAPVPNFLRIRQTARLLALKAMLDIDEGNYDDAVVRCTQCLSLGTDLANEHGTLINHMISVAIVNIGLEPLRYMSERGIDANYGPAIEKMSYIKEKWNENFIKSLECERTMGVDAYRKVINNTPSPLIDELPNILNSDSNLLLGSLFLTVGIGNKGTASSAYLKGIISKIFIAIAKPYFLSDELHYIRCMSRMIKEVKENPSGEIVYDDIYNKYMLSSILIPNISKAQGHNVKTIKDCSELIENLK